MKSMQELIEALGATVKETLGKGDEHEEETPKTGVGANSEGGEVTLETLAKDVAELRKQLEEAKDKGEEEEASDKDDDSDNEELVKNLSKTITDVVAPIKEAVDAHAEVLEKALDRLERLEGGTAVRKSRSADETEDEKPKLEPKEALFKAVADGIRAGKKITMS
jgi:hypothetical protein